MSGIVNVALLRGINVGTAKRIAMADLRRVVEGLGYTGVKTLLNSGNVVFTVPKGATGVAAKRIETAIAAELGVTSRVTVLSATQLARVVDENPLLRVAKNHSRLIVAVFATPADRKRAESMLQEARDLRPEFSLGRHAAYLWCPDGVLASDDAAQFNKRMKDGVTARNWATVLKLQALAAPAK